MSQAHSLDARIRSGAAAWAHIEAECDDRGVDAIMETFSPNEPYAYTVLPMLGPMVTEGSIPNQRFVTSKADLRATYEDVRRFAETRPFRAVAEIRADWYVFLFGVGSGLIRASNQVVSVPAAILFPTMGDSKIRGELMAYRSAEGPPFASDGDLPLSAECAVLERHETLLALLR